MSQYVFILGRNQKLSVAEILAVLPEAKTVKITDSFLVLDNVEIDCQKILKQLGGTIKIGKIISQSINKKLIVETLKDIKSDNKLKFGLSYYGCQKNKLGMEIKGWLKKSEISCRLVVGKDKALSSVIVTKNKVHEFLILENKWLGQTCAVQDFEEYGRRDFGRPVRDMVSGSMPPKLAQIMINLAQVSISAVLLDPFCGSGTILQEAILLGHENVIGSDISDKAIKDTENNLRWLETTYKLPPTSYKLFNVDVRGLSKKIKDVDAIVTEPFLGPPLRGNETRQHIEKNIDELSKLYLVAFSEFKNVLNPGGKIVIVFPSFRVGRDILELPILDQIKKMGFTQVNKDKLIYGRPGQKVYRQIHVFTLSS